MGICCFTGHRQISPDCAEALGRALENAMVKLIQSGITSFRAGGAVGFDTFAALKVIEMRKKYPQLRLCLYLPCKNQSQRWNQYSKDVYEYVISAADEVLYTSEEEYTSGCMQKRNRALVDGSDICIAYCQKDDGGSAYTMRYAQKCGVRVLNLARVISPPTTNR